MKTLIIFILCAASFGSSAQNDSILNQYRGKIIILDFWGVNCPSCLEGMPHLLSLQQTFGDKIKIILVTQDSRKAVDKLWLETKGRMSPSIFNAASQITSIYSDTIFAKLYPLYSIPAQAWFDQQGRFLGLAQAETANEKNINRLLNGEKPVLVKYRVPDPEYYDLTKWSAKRFAPGNEPLSYSFLTSFDDRITYFRNPAFKRDSVTGKPSELTRFNSTILELYRFAYFKNQVSQFDHDRMISVETQDSARYFRPNGELMPMTWMMNNTFCYSSKMPPSTEDAFYDKMKTDLNAYFGIQSAIKIKKIKCLVLRNSALLNQFISTGKDSSMDTKLTGEDGKILIKNSSVSSLCDFLAGYIYQAEFIIPFFNECLVNPRISIEVPWHSDQQKNVVALMQAALRKYGLELTYEYRDLRVLELRDK